MAVDVLNNQPANNILDAPLIEDCKESNGLIAPRLQWHLRNREGYQPLSLYRPYDVAHLWDDRMVVVEGFWPYSRIQIFDSAGHSLKSIAQGEILPFGVTVDTEGYIAVTDHHERTVKFFTPDGTVQMSWQPNMFDWPDGIAAKHGGQYVVTEFTHGIASIHDITGIKLRQFRTTDEDNTQYSCPAYVTVDHHNRIIMTDNYDHSVKVFDQTGRLLLKFGNNAAQQEHIIKDPRGVCVDKYDNILVADWASNCVKLYSPDGQFICPLLTSQEVKYPWGVSMNDSGSLLVSEQKLDSQPGLKCFHWDYLM